MINIAFNVDENFIDKCKVVIRSILANTKEEVMFYVVGTDFTMEGVNIKCFPKVDVSAFKKIKAVGEITVAASYRLFLPEILKDVDKVIYLDCDTVVLKDIKELWEYCPKYIAGVADPTFNYHKNRLKLNCIYINSGVMVMNLKGMREFNFIEKVKEVQESDLNMTLPDQDMLNIIFEKEMQHLPYEWNVYAYEFKGITRGMFEARNNPAIIHWCGSRKPWKSGGAWRAEEFRKYMK